MSVMESFEHPRNVPSDESRPLFVQAFVDSMPLDVDALVKASRFKNSPLFCSARKTCRQVELLTGHARDAPIQRKNGNGWGERKEGLGRQGGGQGGHLKHLPSGPVVSRDRV